MGDGQWAAGSRPAGRLCQAPGFPSLEGDGTHALVSVGTLLTWAFLFLTDLVCGSCSFQVHQARAKQKQKETPSEIQRPENRSGLPFPFQTLGRTGTPSGLPNCPQLLTR